MTEKSSFPKIAVAASGLAMRLAVSDGDLVAIRSYLAGLLALRPRTVPAEPLFMIHFTLFNLLLLYFPCSKLVHLTGAVVCRALLVASPPAYPTRPSAPLRGWLRLPAMGHPDTTAAASFPAAPTSSQPGAPR